MGEEGSIILDRLISEHPEYSERLEEELERTKEKYEITKEELKKERTIRKYYESLLLKYPPKEEKEEFKKIEAVFPYELWEKGLTGYSAEEEERGILKPIARVDRDMFASYPRLAQQPTVESKKGIFESNLHSLDDKLKAGGKLSTDDLIQLIEIDRFAEEHDLSELREKVAKIIVSLEKTIPAEEVELKEGEIKELDEDTLVRKRKNGVIELIIL